MTLASVGTGLTVSGVRWLVIDTILLEAANYEGVRLRSFSWKPAVSASGKKRWGRKGVREEKVSGTDSDKLELF